MGQGQIRRRFVPAVAATALLVGVMFWLSPTLESAVRPPKFDYHISTLDNGMTVVLSEDHSTPIAHVELWYRVGSKNEPPGRTGFAHLFEHLMFKGSHNVQSDQHLTFISSVGGDGNAYTTEDATVFLQTVPSQYLPLVFWLEADRMATLRIDQTTLDAERAVVKEERRWRYENGPFSLLRPADDAPGVQVEHHGEIQPPLVGPHVGNVTGPGLVRPLRTKLTVQHITGDRPDRSSPTQHPVPFLDRPTEPRLSHQSGHAMPPHVVPASLEFGAHTGTSIRAVALLMNGPHLRDEPAG